MAGLEFEQCPAFTASVGFALRSSIPGSRASSLLRCTDRQFSGCYNLFRLLFRRGCCAWGLCLVDQGERMLLSSGPTVCWLSSLLTISCVLEDSGSDPYGSKMVSQLSKRVFPRANLVTGIICFKTYFLKSAILP